MQDETEPRVAVYVSRFNRVVAVVIWAILAFVVVTTVLSTPEHAATALLSGVLIAAIGWLALWNPRVEVSDENVTLVNVLRRIVVPWAALIQVDTKFALTLMTPGHRYEAWAAPAPGRLGAGMARRQARSGNVAPHGGVDGHGRPGDLLSTDSGEAAELVRERWEHLRETGAIELGMADDTRVDVTWLLAPIAVCVALAAGTAIAAALG